MSTFLLPIERCVLFDFAVLPAKPYYFDRQFSFPILDRLLKKQLNVRNFSKFSLHFALFYVSLFYLLYSIVLTVI